MVFEGQALEEGPLAPAKVDPAGPCWPGGLLMEQAAQA